ncbi:MAG: hypothetical protein HW421_1398 [Ignavibacteria bacterium]|nr:hypothetical protein [Ignavibacteria bacterium]
MSEILVKIENPASKKRFIRLLEDLKYVLSFKEIKANDFTTETLSDSDWILAGRPATYEEIHIMIKKSENSPLLNLDEAKKLSFEHLSKIQTVP